MTDVGDSARQARLAATRQAASAFLEDMEHLREVVAREGTSRAELRRLSIILRRLVVDRDIKNVADPRIGRVKIRTKDFRPYYRLKNTDPSFFMAAETQLFGEYAGKFHLFAVPASFMKNSPTEERVMATPESRIGDLKSVDLNLDGFMNQQVLMLHGQWVTRRHVIKHMCNVASTAHSGVPTKPEDITIARIRNFLTISKQDDGKFNHYIRWEDSNQTPDQWAEYTPRTHEMDPALIELLGTATCLINSPDLERLECSIRNELG